MTRQSGPTGECGMCLMSHLSLLTPDPRTGRGHDRNGTVRKRLGGKFRQLSTHLIYAWMGKYTTMQEAHVQYVYYLHKDNPAVVGNVHGRGTEARCAVICPA